MQGIGQCLACVLKTCCVRFFCPKYARPGTSLLGCNAGCLLIEGSFITTPQNIPLHEVEVNRPPRGHCYEMLCFRAQVAGLGYMVEVSLCSPPSTKSCEEKKQKQNTSVWNARWVVSSNSNGVGENRENLASSQRSFALKAVQKV